MKAVSISIILPTYKDARYIVRAIESVRAQYFTDWELILVDDGLDLNALKIIENFQHIDQRIIYIKNEKNLGIQKSLNKGLKEAKGEYIARIDDDDEWIDPKKLEMQVNFFKQYPEYLILGTNAVICNEEGKELGRYTLPETDSQIRKRLLSKNCFLHPTIMVRKSAILRVGGYNESEDTKHIEDYALWLALGIIGKFANLSISAVRLTIHKNSMTFQNRLIQAKRMFAIIGKYKKSYPNFFIGRFILSLRIIGFTILKIIPIPQKLLYSIQNIYKRY